MAKQEESKFDKFKQLLGIGGRRGHHGSGNISNIRPATREFILTNELLKELSSESSSSHRLKTIRELCETVTTKRLEHNAVEAVWIVIKDLLKPSVPVEDRHTVFRFLQCLVNGQYEELGVMRAHFFSVIKGHALFEDLSPRLDLLKALSSDGKHLEYFEEEMGRFLLEWMKDIMSSKRIADFLRLAINVIKFNAAYLDEEVVAELVMNTCIIATKTSQEECVDLCLKLLDTVICYSYLPQSSLDHFVIGLCQVLAIERFAHETWNLMRKLLGTHLGHSAIHSMCCILQDNSDLTGDGALLLRGAVFFISMALWGHKRVASLKYPPSAVLPAFLQSLKHTTAQALTNEIVLSVQRLVNKYGQEQPSVTWDLILDIVQAVFNIVEAHPTASPVLVSNLHDMLTTIENLYEQGEFHGSKPRFFSIIENCANKRPENSIVMLVAYKAQGIYPSVKDNWILELDYLLEKYYKQESRTKIRLKALESMNQIITRNKYLHEDDLLEMVILPKLSHIDHDTDTEVKVKVIAIVTDLLEQGHVTWYAELYDILNRVISHPFCSSLLPLSPTLSGSETRLHERPKSTSMDTDDVLPAISGLVQLFKKKLYQGPSEHAVKAYELLVNHLKAHYGHPHYLVQSNTGKIRHKIFELFLDLRADSSLRLGLIDRNKDGQVNFTSTVICSESEENLEPETESPQAGRDMCVMPYADIFTCIRLCVEKEMDWTVLKLVLERMPHVLRNKTLLLAARPDDLDNFFVRLCVMVGDRNVGLPEKLTQLPQSSMTKSDFHSYIFPVLTCLVSYHTMLDKNKQQELVKCLEFGLVSKCNRICVRALTVCALEMQDVMRRQLHCVLIRLSQISATVAMAIPLMEFLSSLIHVPQLYRDFSEDQYMSVFAIALPYTNPFKYSHYTVSLAYHVVGLWFIKCRLPFRKGFVGFIIKNLKSNVLRQLKEIDSQRARLNQDSSDRFRTHSLNEEALRSTGRAAMAMARARQNLPPSHLLDEEMSLFHRELMETCVDMLARYTFSTRSNLPKRSPVSEFLLKDGQQQSWLLGNRIITITTGGGGKVGRSGLCENCLMAARKMSAKVDSSQTVSTEPAPSGRRRHKTTAERSRTESISLKPGSQDDIQVNHRMEPLLPEVRPLRSESFRNDDADMQLESESAQPLSPPPLETRTEKIQAMDSVLMGLKAKPTDKSIFSPHLCNCWCTQWSEIHIRNPTGTLSWMMRTQNEEDITEQFPEFPLADISNFFRPDNDFIVESPKIDGTRMPENQYESLLQEHFNKSEDLPDTILPNLLPIGPQPKTEQSDTDVFSKDETDDSMNMNHLELRKTASSPEFCRPSSTPPESQAKKLRSAKDEVQNLYIPPTYGASETDSNTGPDMDEQPEETEEHSLELSPKSPKSRRRPPSSPSGINRASSTTSFTSIPEDEAASCLREQRHSDQSHRPTVTFVDIHHESHSDRSKKADSNKPGTSSLSTSLFAHEKATQGGVSPSYLFLQLYHSSFFGGTDQKPIRLPQNETVARSIKMLDMIYPFQTHKVGVLYVAKGQAHSEAAILSNQYGSVRYMNFLQNLGTLICLKDSDPSSTYLGGLDSKGSDGKFAYRWEDQVVQVVYHVATLMPNKESDPNCNQKKLHIGNDYINIVYNDSGMEYKMGTIKCQFNYVNIVIEPLDHASNAVTVQTRDGIEDIFGHTDTKIMSDTHLSTLVRQMALHADVASIILQKQKINPKDLFASNWLERLRHIKRIRSKVLLESSSSPPSQPDFDASVPMASVDDFTDFVS